MSQIEPLQPRDLDRLLPVLLAVPGSRQAASAAHLRSFHDYLACGPLGWEGLRCGPVGKPTGVFFALLVPGATAIVMIPPPGEHGIDPDEQRRLTHAGMEWLRRRPLHYAQALVEPEAAGKRGLLLETGFQPLAPLLYLERDTRYPWVDPPTDDEAEWVAFNPRTRAEFAQVILATYRDSRDCPELTGLRPIDDVLAAHQGTGQFDPQLWELARVGGQAAGCILLAPICGGQFLEVVYMGVVPEHRGRRVGALLLRRALAACRARRARLLTVVVDGRNAPARRLYERFAFTCAGWRDALLYRWSTERGAQPA